MQRPLCIVVAGDPVPRTAERLGGFADLIRRATGSAWTGGWRLFDARSGARGPDPSSVAGLIVTGSASSVTSRDPWIVESERYLCTAVAESVPVLGICFGHQLLGQALGGRVERNPRGREMGTVELEVVAEDPLLDDRERPYLANMSHQDSVVELPDGARVLGRTEREPHAAVRFGETAWGVQFHPEFDREVMTEYIETRFQSLLDEGQDAAGIRSAARDAPGGGSVLRRFVEHALAARAG
jgi:GMP synthase (glutamine-hydrolysing)